MSDKRKSELSESQLEEEYRSWILAQHDDDKLRHAFEAGYRVGYREGYLYGSSDTKHNALHSENPRRQRLKGQQQEASDG